MRVGSLFAGIGGFDLAARNVGWHTTWYSEIDPYACRVMAKHFPDAVNLGDITTITNPPAVDVLVGGFPCQDISHAGKGAGIASGTRSGLWYEYRRIIGEIRPRWVIAENVAALRTRGLGQVLSDLDALGYVGEWHCIPASAVGAPHQRDRIWIVANANSERRRSRTRESAWGSVSDWDQARDSGDAADTTGDRRAQRRFGDQGRDDTAAGGIVVWSEPSRVGAGGRAAVVPDAVRERLEGQRTQPRRVVAQLHDAGNNRWWATEPNVGRVAHGIPARVDRLRCLGNAIVPQVAEMIFRAINDAEGAAC